MMSGRAALWERWWEPGTPTPDRDPAGPGFLTTTGSVAVNSPEPQTPQRLTQDILQSQTNGLSMACFQTQKSTCLDRPQTVLGCSFFRAEKEITQFN